MSYADQQQAGNKTASIAIVVIIHVAVGYLLVTGLAIDAVKQVVERVTTVEVKEEEPPPPDEPPPPPEDQPQPTSPPPPNAPPALVDIPRESPIQATPQDTPRVPVDPRPTVVEAPPGPPTPPKPPSKARGVRTKNERSWVARIIENYPPRAVREELEGTVGVRVTVTTEGRATGCTVTSSSGHDVLDTSACKDVERYARFDPALDDAGNPTSASWSTRITYRLN